MAPEATQALSTLAWVLFGAAVALAAALGLILCYHWIHYAMDRKIPLLAVVIYVGGCFLFVSTMFAAVISL